MGWQLQIGDVFIDSQAVKSVWYRKGSFWFDHLDVIEDRRAITSLGDILRSRLAQESSVMRGYFHFLLRSNDVRILGHAQMGDVNKLVVCKLAREAGLRVPDYVVTNDCDCAFSFVQQGASITKASGDGLFAWDYDVTRRAYFSYTELISPADVATIQAGRMPTYLQRCVDKAYEVRSFYLDGQFFSCAILSQEDAMTAIDYRKYNKKRPTRKLPIELPSEITVRTKVLFNHLGLNTGSIDFMVDDAGAYYFLEINPCGQFGAISNACGFDLHQEVARWLCGQEVAHV